MSSPKETIESKEDFQETKQVEDKPSDDNIDTSNENKEDTSNPESSSLWTAVWDDNAQAYYWWNTETNETTWINPEQPIADYSVATPTAVTPSNPLDFLLDRIDTDVKKQLDGEEPSRSPSYQSYNQYFEPSEASYATTAHFNSRTGRFTTQEDASRLNPDNLTIENRATRQMQFYFDVDRYTEERNMQREYTADGRVGKKKQLTRKEVEYFKKMKKEKKSKKAREWLMQ
ncbi:hypothetical protein HPULCUR_004438 [Helicostylum pulchrum]|uniref:WW domain-containing protein n=1 Tax=Helicostylum pulchrum TaxID=562976 RepID=A0ABP9XW79_9FUNG